METTEQFLKRYEAGDPEAIEFWETWKQELRRAIDALPPDLLRFLRQHKARRAQNPDDWYQAILMDVFDETPIENVAPFIRNRIDEYLNRPPQTLAFKPAGRTPDEYYDQAYNKLENGEAEAQVFDWICEQKGINKPGKSERDAFKKAMSRRDQRT